MVFKTNFWSFWEWPFYTGFTVVENCARMSNNLRRTGRGLTCTPLWPLRVNCVSVHDSCWMETCAKCSCAPFVNPVSGNRGSCLGPVLWPWARHINPSLVLFQPRKGCPDITEKCWLGRKESNQSNQTVYKGYQQRTLADRSENLQEKDILNQKFWKNGLIARKQIFMLKKKNNSQWNNLPTSAICW